MTISWHDWQVLLLLFVVGAIASGINAVAGGGSLISFPTLAAVSLFGNRMPLKDVNATNSVALWPGSLTGALGFWNLFHKTKQYLSRLWIPTLLGSGVGAWLLISTNEKDFRRIVPALVLLATFLLAFQPQIKAYATAKEHHVSHVGAIVLQFLVALYGGYFGAGMGIMMIAVFALYMDANIHEINAVKGWLGMIINLVCSTIFVVKGMVHYEPAIALTLGSLIGGYFAARFSQKVQPEKLRIWIAIYGFITAAYFAYQYWL